MNIFMMNLLNVIIYLQKINLVKITSNGTELKTESDKIEPDIFITKYHSENDDQEQTIKEDYEFHYTVTPSTKNVSTNTPTTDTTTTSSTPHLYHHTTNSTTTPQPPPHPTHPTLIITDSSTPSSSSVKESSTTDLNQETTVNYTIDPSDRDLNDLNQKVDGMQDSTRSIKLVENSVILRNILSKHTMKTNNSLINTVMIMGKIDKFSRSVNKELMANFTDNMAESCNEVLDHNEAWQNVDQNHMKIEMSSSILDFIRTTGFNLGCNRNITKNTKIIKSNVAIETYSLDSENTMHIKLNGSKSGIILPVGMPDIDPDTGCDRGTAVGAVVSKITNYLGANLEKHQEINTNIIVFSIKNSRNSTELTDIPPVKIV